MRSLVFGIVTLTVVQALTLQSNGEVSAKSSSRVQTKELKSANNETEVSQDFEKSNHSGVEHGSVHQARDDGSTHSNGNHLDRENQDNNNGNFDSKSQGHRNHSEVFIARNNSNGNDFADPGHGSGRGHGRGSGHGRGHGHGNGKNHTDNGNHFGWYNHGSGDGPAQAHGRHKGHGTHTDNGNHFGWYKHGSGDAKGQSDESQNDDENEQ